MHHKGFLKIPQVVREEKEGMVGFIFQRTKDIMKALHANTNKSKSIRNLHQPDIADPSLVFHSCSPKPEIHQNAQTS